MNRNTIQLASKPIPAETATDVTTLHNMDDGNTVGVQNMKHEQMDTMKQTTSTTT